MHLPFLTLIFSVAASLCLLHITFGFYNARDYSIRLLSYATPVEGIAALEREKYRSRLELLSEPSDPERIVFFGDSHIQNARLDTLFPKILAVNLGISGDTTEGGLKRIGRVSAGRKAAAFVISYGYNDLKYRDIPDIIHNITKILDNLSMKTDIGYTGLLLQSVLPVSKNRDWLNRKITELNYSLRRLCDTGKCRYLDVNSAVTNKQGYMEPSVSYDGVHLNSNGYFIWARVLISAINSAKLEAAK